MHPVRPLPPRRGRLARRRLVEVGGGGGGGWTFLTNHSHVLICFWRDPDARLRDVAAAVGITERAVQKIVVDLQRAEVLSVTRRGRRNHYAIDPAVPMRHTVEAALTVGQVLGPVAEKG